MKQIIITISPTGETKLETKGYSGAACKDGSKFLEQSLGTKTGETLTSDYYKTTTGPQVTQ